MNIIAADPSETLPSLIDRAVSGAGVYIAMDERGHVKIGVTIDVAKRLSSLSTGSSDAIHLIRFIEGATRPTEKWLHKRFRSNRTKGEWFTFDPAMMDVVPPDELPKRRRIVIKRDVRLTLRERLRAHAEMMNGIDAAPSQRLSMLVQSLTDDECAAVLEQIHAFANNHAGAA